MGGGDHKNVSIVSKKKKKNGSFKSIFMHADVLDWFFMVFGLLGAIGDGIMTPLVLFITSKIMNSLGGSSTTTSNNFIHNINKVFFSIELISNKQTSIFSLPSFSVSQKK